MAQIQGQDIEIQAGQTCADALRGVLSGKKLKSVVACECDGTLVDLTRTVPAGTATLEPVFLETPEGLAVLRHSAAHVMAEAVKELFPSAKVTIGPDIENGFYYAFDYERPFTPEDLEKIEARMRASAAANRPFSREEMGAGEAKALFASMGETYKLEIIDDLGADRVSVYRHGDFVDLCRGPHLPSTGFLQAFKLTAVAGAYWRGDSSRPMLQRIYGTAFATPKELKAHLTMIEEAKKRDHRKLGPQLDLFSFHEGGAGMAYWHPKGGLVRTILEDFVNKEMIRRGYGIVRTPQILKRDLWETSGHYANYRENMYFTEIDEVPYGVKPMNCVAHMLIYNTSQRSYRDLPVRLFEFGVVHRHELSGVLHGLMRVRQFTQDDAHIICRPDQLQDEIKGVMRWIQDLMGVFDFEYTMEISTRPETSIRSDADWERATAALMDGPALRHQRGRRRLLRAQDRRQAARLPRAAVAVLDHPGRFHLAGSFRLGIRGRGWRAAPAGHGAPRHHGVCRAVHRHPHGTFRRGLPGLARARAGPHPDRDRQPQRICPFVPGSVAARRGARGTGSAQREARVQGARGPAGEDSVRTGHR